MRLFIAAELPELLVEELAETSALLRDTIRGRYVPPSNYHVTLAFLGDVAGSRVDDVVRALEEGCAGCGPIEVSLGPLGCFGRRRNATLWQAVEHDGSLARLATSVRGALRDRGFAFDEKGFLAHITLMRSADLSCDELPMPHVTNGIINEVTLFSSDLSGKHPVYTPVHTVELGTLL